VVASRWHRLWALFAIEVSIPFIAGQWSLPQREIELRKEAEAFQSPSLRGSGRFHRRERPGGRRLRVSIPFIAGQWSLHWPQPTTGRSLTGFQSPSLRGSGRFCPGTRNWPPARSFQSPSLRGSGRFSPIGDPPKTTYLEVSIPFIAGQWSLRPLRFQNPVYRVRFQSPSLRGSGRFSRLDRAGWTPPPLFQSPSLRGSGRFAKRRTARAPRSGRFNPLHCGAVVASGGNDMDDEKIFMFQSPSLRGSGRFAPRSLSPGATQ